MGSLTLGFSDKSEMLYKFVQINRKTDFCKSELFCYDYSKLEIKTLFQLKSCYFLSIVSEFFDNNLNPYSNNNRIQYRRNVCKRKKDIISWSIVATVKLLSLLRLLRINAAFLEILGTQYTLPLRSSIFFKGSVLEESHLDHWEL